MPRGTSISDRLRWASSALSNAETQPEIASRLEPFGYGPDRWAKARTIFQTASEAVTKQTSTVGDFRAASADVRAAERAVRDVYQAVAQVARTIFARKVGALAGLGLDNPMPRKVSALITKALALFDNAANTPSLAEALAAHGCGADRLADGRAKVLALIEAARAQDAARGDAQQATEDMRTALTALEDEMRVLRGLAKVALRDRPQLLEKLRIVKRSAPTAAQRGASKKAAATRKQKKDQSTNGNGTGPAPA